MCQPVPTGLYTRQHLNSETVRFTPRQSKTRSLEKRPEGKIENFYTPSRQNKTDRFCVHEFCSLCNTVFQAMGCFDHFCPCQEVNPSLTQEDIQRGSEKREIDQLRRIYIQKKGFTVTEKWKCEWWRLYKTTTNFELPIRESFRYRRSRTEHQLPEGIKKGNLTAYVQCNIEVLGNLRANFANFPSIFKNTLVGKSDIGDLKERMPKKKVEILRIRKGWYQASQYKTELWLLSCCCCSFNWGFWLQKDTASLSILHRNVSPALYSQQKTMWRISEQQCSRRDVQAPGP